MAAQFDRTCVVSAKNGAIVRKDAEMSSEEVETLEKGTVVRVDSERTLSNGTVRCHIADRGWVSSKTLKSHDVKPQVCVLHGTAANGKIVRIQLGALLPKLSSVDLVFVDGPRLASEGNAQYNMMRSFFGKDQVLREFGTATLDDRGWRTYDGVDRAVDEAEAAVRARFPGAPPRALLGFSQGANFTTMLAARAERRGEPYACVVLFCGARPGWAKQMPSLLFETPLATPALLVAAKEDTVVGDGPYEMAKLFASPVVLTHAEGHKPLPSADPEALNALTSEIAAFLRQHTITC
ncbi:hypothetical protein CTAYLR_010416 [Chrysophaeum taylorii]|uniref:Serine hydrolase domain-containing protein n=1 Tax=Chrysophaeum taylorii TaxID=2483200 RepID=A0AAD7UHJ3_9STRA|nr:hypothetical protein CTAYLR_010416 [Chrysophaeum taylorii]